MTLQDYFTAHPKGILGFSGGTDSAFLLAEGLRFGADLLPCFVDSPFQPRQALSTARAVCRQLGAALLVLETDPLSDPEIRSNPPLRCYHCKKRLFSLIQSEGKKRGYELVLEGTNASDDISDRPGMKALTQLAVESPLRICGYTKAQIRQESQALGLSTWNTPSYACLATRIPTGVPLTGSDLQRAERGEQTLRALGFSDLRLRIRGESALLQLPVSQHDAASRRLEEISQALSSDFIHISLDPTPRKGE